MIMLVFTVRDEKVGAFMPPFFARSRGEAVRSFMQVFDDKEHAFARSPGDYVLYALGSFDDNSGLIDSREPERLMGGLEVKAPS